MMNESGFLPLGTAVMVDGDESAYILVSRSFEQEEEEMFPIYRGVPHPYGAGGGYQILSIREDEIVDVLLMGYETQEDATHATKILKECQQKKAEATTVSSEEESVPEEKGVTQEEQLAKDPFYLLREQP